MQRLATDLLVLLLVASVAPAASAAGAPDRTGVHSYAGTHVSFDVDDRAVTDYAVDGETILDSLRVASRERVEESDPVDANASLSAATHVDGAGLNLTATTGTEARIAAETGATLAAHDNRHGVLVVASGEGTDYAVADLPPGASAAADGDAAVAVTTENGTEATVFVVGEGAVGVTDAGDVTARLGEDARLAVRSYPAGKDAADDERERLLADGAASAEVYVTTERGTANGTGNASNAGNADDPGSVTDPRNASDGESASDAPRAVVDAVTYDDNTTVTADRVREGDVSLAVNRTTREGTILLASVSPALLDADQATVTVDGEAAAEAATYSQLAGAVGSQQSRYVVAEGANASAEVGVGVSHFSERIVAVTSPEAADPEPTSAETTGGETPSDGATTGGPASDDGATARGSDTDSENGGPVPGFTPAIAVAGLLAAVVAAVALARVR
ncbi:hypothetical protein [Halorussus halobius]|uniref:hypothetical protein n=1 Tax=Halorussus halobius TaxID=1710537 RepID=UPI0010931856|nr:hypothetical protein [Halorussus halobius]